MPRLCASEYWAQQNLKLLKTRAHAKRLSSVPWSNAPTCPSHMFCLCTIAELLDHDHRRQREQHLDGMYPLQHWTCFPEATSNLLHVITHLPLWKKKRGVGGGLGSRGAKKQQAVQELNAFNSQVHFISRLALDSLHGKKTFVDHRVIIWCGYTLIFSF